ncbi:hypothetical protein [Streptomyces sp. NPDC019937]|uniref:hypothetical protein n=1 Tax=Streptomyces sp. NPDC019937 TaxID=3154787 RepID=UPI0033E486C3
MAKLSSLVDPFTDGSINTALWNNTTAGAVTLDTVNDLVMLACPTTSGANNTFGSNQVFDATASQISAQIGVVPNGNGGTKTIFKLVVDANNSVAIRVESGVFKFTLQTAGSTVTTTLPTYSPDAHRWWRLREAAGTWYAEASPDGLSWSVLTSSTYTWTASATAMTFVLQAGAAVTELPGQSATIQHINTPLGGPANLNWPAIEHGWGARWNCNGGDSPLDRYTDMGSRTRGTTTINRGRQYELDQVRAAEASIQLANPDGVLDPVNTSGPYFGHILPYQPYRIRAQWPATRNLLSQFQATGGDLGGYPLGAIDQGNAGPSTFNSTDGANFVTVASSSAWQGGTVIQASVPVGTAPPTGILTPGLICWTPQPNALPGETYTMQMRVRNITPGTSLQVAPCIYSITAAVVGTTNVGSAVTLTGSATAGWTTLTITATLGPDAASSTYGVRVAATAAATCTIQVDGWQVEHGSVASQWTCPGTWYPMYGGFVERWSPEWEMSGTYGTMSPTCVDAFSLLSQVQLSDPLTLEINNHSPRFLYKLDDPQGSTSFADATGNFPPAQIGAAKLGPGSLVAGTAITSASSTGAYTGSDGTVVTISNPEPGTGFVDPASFISLTGAGIKGPANTAGAWTRMIAFRYTGPNPTGFATMWSSFDKRVGGGSALYWRISTGGLFQVVISGPTGSAAQFQPTTTNYADSNWHLAIASYDHATMVMYVSIDNNLQGGDMDLAWEPAGLVSDSVGGWIDPTTGNGSAWQYKGDLSFVAEFPTALSPTDMTNLYTAWKSSCAGESTDARYRRILRYSGYLGPSSIQTGLTTSMGPAAIDGQDAVTALQAVVETEGGEHYVDRAGTVTFRSRSARYNAITPALVFGERADLGEWPYEDCALDYDSTHLSNQVTVTQASSGQTFYEQDPTGITNYFPRTLTRTINSSSALECQDAAGYLLSRYKQPAVRVASLKLHPSANPTLWPVLLGLELGARVRVIRRPPGAPPITVDCFVESIQWDLGDDADAWVTLQCSPADVTPYGVIAAWHTTLKTSVASGVTSIVINASQDTTNPLKQQLAVGQQLVLGQGTANQETVTISAIGATSPGWTSATIVLTAATTKAHTAGDLINEPLPAGITDPTTWDSVAALDDMAFAY